jgi:hypothetical protein
MTKDLRKTATITMKLGEKIKPVQVPGWAHRIERKGRELSGFQEEYCLGPGARRRLRLLQMTPSDRSGNDPKNVRY